MGSDSTDPISLTSPSSRPTTTRTGSLEDSSPASGEAVGASAQLAKASQPTSSSAGRFFSVKESVISDSLTGSGGCS